MNDQNRFAKFTERARKVLSLAQEESQRFQHNYIGSEHLLLGLLREGEGVAAKVLMNLGLDMTKLRQATEKIVGRGNRIVLGEIGLTPHAKLAVQLAADEARRLQHHYIGTEHLLLGLAQVPDDTLVQILQSVGISQQQLNVQTIQIVSQAQTVRLPNQPPSTSTSAESSEMPIGSTGLPYSLKQFTEQARRVLSQAREEAQRTRQSYVDTEHLLIALLREEKSASAVVLKNLGVDPRTLRGAVEYIATERRDAPTGITGFTERARIVIRLAMDEARRINHQHVGVEHLLLGLIREGEGVAAALLETLGVTLEKARNETLRTVKRMPQAKEATEQEPTTSMPQVLVQNEGIKPFQGYAFTEQTNKILEQARKEAERFQHNYIGTEHLLLGVVGIDEGVASTVLQNLGVEPNKVRSAVEFIIGLGDRIVVGEIGLTPRAKKVIELAADEARKLGSDSIGTEHVLLGLVREGEGIAAGVLESMGVKLDRVVVETMRVLRSTSDDTTDEA